MQDSEDLQDFSGLSPRARFEGLNTEPGLGRVGV